MLTYTPITKEWTGSGTNLTVTFDIVRNEYLSLYTNNTLEKRTDITTVLAAATIVDSISSVILAASAGLEIHEDIAAIIKSKSNQSSCSLVYGTDSDGTYVEEYAYVCGEEDYPCGNREVCQQAQRPRCDSRLLHHEPRWYMDGTFAFNC
ncbi:hypothetical protein CNMCM6936_001749 [Aspergillus lentulus]|nr:hypothetical protein CNMCM6069_003186 [Aspergillus lentulus]KAF4162668.1 hypothetical protein CNMCM6936_001749 [Aspergillus lentulus]KAF4171309.1 hypothetical protein CNMCM8060_003142 [Aspergillus lentulus]KAF4193653.1 hypothetical protein CNMCM8694_008533 [Aspergillus lentulus]